MLLANSVRKRAYFFCSRSHSRWWWW